MQRSADALRAFGVHWVENTVAKQYETLMRAAGSDMLGFLATDTHDRISSTFWIIARPPLKFRTVMVTTSKFCTCPSVG